jgi:hypothetical protein
MTENGARENGYTFRATHISLYETTILSVTEEALQPFGEVHFAPRYEHLLSPDVV